MERVVPQAPSRLVCSRCRTERWHFTSEAGPLPTYWKFVGDGGVVLCPLCDRQVFGEDEQDG